MSDDDYDIDAAGIVSVHDVTPETLPAVERILSLLAAHEADPVTLLVVPGAGWDEPGIARLRAWREEGYELAGHGWSHRAAPTGRLWARLHSALVSQGVAEHLPLESAGIERLIEQCFAWFRHNGLGDPALYVPPAWAMGRLSRNRLRRLPFERYETLRGVYEVADRRFYRMPLLGYEARRAWTAPFLRLFNATNRARARRTGVLRIAIHPPDLDLPLATDLRQDLAAITTWRSYAPKNEPP